MAKFNLNDYELVEDRLKKFWKDNPDARINTEIAHITEDGTCVTVRAEVFKNEQDARPVATGIAGYSLAHDASRSICAATGRGRTWRQGFSVNQLN